MSFKAGDRSTAGRMAKVRARFARRTRIMAAVVAVLALSATCFADDSISASDRKMLADSLFHRELYKLALPEYRELAEKHADHPELDQILFRFGETLRHLGQPKEAEIIFRRLTIQHQDSALYERAVLIRALLFLELKHYSIAAELLESLLMRETTADIQATALYHAAEARQLNGETAAATDLYQRLYTQFKEHRLAPFAELRWARLRSSEGTSEALNEALKTYLRISKQKADDEELGSEAVFQAALLSDKTGDSGYAAALYRELSTRYPNSKRAAEAFRPAAWANLRSGRFIETLDYAKKSLAKAASLSAEEQSEWLYLQGNAHHQLKQNPDAIASYSELLAKFPNAKLATAARFERLVAYYKSDLFAELLDDAASFNNPPEEQLADFWWMQANAAEAIKDSPRATQFYRLLIRDAPKHPLVIDATYRLAYQLQQHKAWNEASRHYLEVAERWPTNQLAPKALFASGICLSLAGQTDEALRDWHILMQRFPEHETIPDALFQKSQEEIKADRLKDAAATLDKLLDEHPKYGRLAEAYYWRAQLAYSRKDYNLAESMAKASLAQQVSLEIANEASFLLGLALHALDRGEEAAAVLQPLLESKIGERFSFDRLAWLSNFQYDRKAWTESESAARAILSRPEVDVGWQQAAGTLLGRALEAQDKLPEAGQAYRAAIGTGAKTRYAAEANFKLGSLLMRSGQWEEAESTIRQAISLASTPETQGVKVRSHAALAEIREKIGDKEGALKFHILLATLYQDEEIVPHAYDRAVAILAELGRSEEARKMAIELLELYPKSQQAAKWSQQPLLNDTPKQEEAP